MSLPDPCPRTLDPQERRFEIPMRDLKFALFVVWIVVSIAVMFAILSPLFFSTDSIYSWFPECYWKVYYGKSCILCGMTTAFIHISRGDLANALFYNKYSVFLYFLFVMNEIVLVLLLSGKIRKT